MLVVEDLTVDFSGNSGRGLKGVSFSVGFGEFVVLMGRNGSGKSTILDCVAGYRSCREGHIAIGSINLTNMPAYRRADHVSLISQHSGIGFPYHMRVGEVLALCSSRGRSMLNWMDWRREAESLGRELGELLPHLERRLDDQILTLSGGEFQLLSLACLKLSLKSGDSSHALLLDEHVASLDPLLARQVLAISKAITKSYSLSTLMVSHSFEFACQFADRLLILNEQGNARSFMAGELPNCLSEMEKLLVA